MPKGVITHTGDWISVAEAGRRLGRSLDVATRLAKSGAVRTRKLPGCRVEIHAADLDRLNSECVRPAAANA